MAGLGTSILLSLATAVAPPPLATSCLARAGTVTGQGSTLPMAVRGIELQKSRAIEKLRKKTKDGIIIVIEGGDFTEYDFRKAKLNNICFKGSKLTHTNWTGANVAGAGFIDSDLSGAVFTGAMLRGALFRTTTMANMDATAADFSEGQLDGGWNASIKNLKLDLAKMNRFKFVCGSRAVDGCPFDRQGISARNTDFSGATFDGFALWGANVAGAIFDGAIMAVEDVGQIVGGTEPSVINVRYGAMSTLVDGPVAMALAGALTTTNTVANQCTNPQGPMQIAICEDKSGTLRAFDADIVRMVAAGAPEKKKAIVTFERGRNACLAGPTAAKIACLTTVLRDRRNGLLASTQPMQWMRRAGRVLFVRNDLQLASGATLQPSWPGIAQVLVRLSPSYMLARVEGPKRVAVRGAASEGTTAACSVDVVTSPSSAGNFIASAMLPGKKRTSPTPLFRVVGEQAVLTQAQDDGSAQPRVPICNGAAPFGTMKRLPIDTMTFDTLWTSTKPVIPSAVASAASKAPDAPVSTNGARP